MKYLVGLGLGVFVSVVTMVFLASIYLPTSLVTDCQRCNRAEADIQKINLAVAEYSERYGGYPSSNEGLSVLSTENPAQAQKDPWGREYNYYSFSGLEFNCYAVWSFGSDGVPGGKDEHSKDIHVFGESGNCLANE